MSAEKLNNSPENFENKTEVSIDKPEQSVEKRPETITKPEQIEKKPDLETIQKAIDREAKKSEEVSDLNKSEKNQADNTFLVSQELKVETLKRSIKKIQKRLPKTSRALSKVVHQPVVSKVSKVGEKTIARPTGILTGSLLALLGSSYVLFSAKRYGYKYNFSVAIVLFVGGYLLGLAIEFIGYFLRRYRGVR